MHTNRYLRGVYALVLVMSGMIGGANATSSNTDLSDIWWNPNESGWGMQMVNTGTFVFATIYVYGQNAAPTWVTGQLSLTGAAQTTYTGPLYATTGPYFGGFFDPNAVTQRQVGTMTFVLTSVTTGQLTYSVDGNVVVKSVQRTPLTLDNYNGTYVSTLTRTDSGCSNPANNVTFTVPVTVGVSQNGPSIAVVVSSVLGSCSIVGTYSQLGRMGQIVGTYDCGVPPVGTATIFEMNNVPFMFTARLQANSPSNGCSSSGEIAGLIAR